MNDELKRELQKLNTELAGLVVLIPNPLVRQLVEAVVARLVKILFLLIEGKKDG